MNKILDKYLTENKSVDISEPQFAINGIDIPIIPNSLKLYEETAMRNTIEILNEHFIKNQFYYSHKFGDGYELCVENLLFDNQCYIALYKNEELIIPKFCMKIGKGSFENGSVLSSMLKKAEEEKTYSCGQKFRIGKRAYILFINSQILEDNCSQLIASVCIESDNREDIGKCCGNEIKVANFRRITIEEFDKICEGHYKDAELIED